MIVFLQLNFPPFGSSLHYELYRKPNGQHYLQFIYRKRGVDNPEPMDIPGIGQKWTLEQFYSVFEKIIPVGDYDEECRI